MSTTLTQIAALLLSTALLLMGNGLQATLLPLRAQAEMFSTFEIGVIGSAYYLGFAAGCIWGPHLVKRVGHVRAFTAMVALASAAPLIQSIWTEPLPWWVMRAATGFCLATLYMIIESWLSEKSTNSNRGVVFSIYTIINLTVVSLGQLMINLATIDSFVLFSVASVLVSLAAVPLSLSRAAAPAQIKTVRLRLGHLFRLSPLGVTGALIVGLQQGAFWSLGPVFAREIGLDVMSVTFFMCAAVLGGALGQWPLGMLSDRIDRRKVLVGACLAAAVVGLLIRTKLPILGEGIMILAFLWGMVALPLYAICAAHMNDHVEEGGYVEASSGLLLALSIGAIIGPLIVSPLMQAVTPYALFGMTAIFQLVLVAISVWRLSTVDAVPAEDRTAFTESLQESSRVYHDDSAPQPAPGPR